jgi:hypothetical protein
LIRPIADDPPRPRLHDPFARPFLHLSPEASVAGSEVLSPVVEVVAAAPPRCRSAAGSPRLLEYFDGDASGSQLSGARQTGQAGSDHGDLG